MAGETIADRLERLIDQAVRAGQFGSRAQVLAAAKLSSGYLAELKTRAAKDPECTVSTKTAGRLARVLGLTVDELTGQQRPEEPPLVDKYANRAWAVQAARALQLPEGAIRIVIREDPGGEPSRIYWFRRIEAESERLRPASGLLGKE